MKKKTKASAVMVLLKKGYSVKEIKERISVSESYIHAVKKLMAAGVEAEVENDDDVVRPRLVGPHTVKRVTKTEAEAIKAKPGEFIQADTNVDAILDERGSRYGNFLDHARITQRLKEVAHGFAAHHGKTFDVDQAEALDMIFHKIGRILNGDPNYADSWIDIAGYAKLVADRLEGKVR
jgi:hypothetical protein